MAWAGPAGRTCGSRRARAQRRLAQGEARRLSTVPQPGRPSGPRPGRSLLLRARQASFGQRLAAARSREHPCGPFKRAMASDWRLASLQSRTFGATFAGEAISPLAHVATALAPPQATCRNPRGGKPDFDQAGLRAWRASASPSGLRPRSRLTARETLASGDLRVPEKRARSAPPPCKSGHLK